MNRLFLILIVFSISFATYSQSFLGKSKAEIKEIVSASFDEVEIISETATTLKMECDSEVNEFFISEDVCVKFTSQRSYNCECLGSVITAYNENLQSVGTMKWLSKDGSKLYEIFMNKKDYIVSLSNHSSDLALLESK